MKKKIKPSYVPVVKSLGDVSNFDEYPDSGTVGQDIKPSLDPFLTWWYNVLFTFILYSNLSEINKNLSFYIKNL